MNNIKIIKYIDIISQLYIICSGLVQVLFCYKLISVFDKYFWYNIYIYVKCMKVKVEQKLFDCTRTNREKLCRMGLIFFFFRFNI